MEMKRIEWLLVLGGMFVVGAGCESSADAPPTAAAHSDEHEHHDDHGHAHPETLADAVHELTELRNTVRDAFAKEDTEAAHGPLHDVGHLLEDAESLAQKAGLTEETLTSVKASIETLFDAFGAVDKTMHGQEGSKYSEVSDKIDAAIKVLQDAAAPQAAADATDAPSADAPSAGESAATDNNETPSDK